MDTKMEYISCPYCGAYSQFAVPIETEKILARRSKVEGDDGQYVFCSGCNTNYWAHIWITDSFPKRVTTKLISITCPYDSITFEIAVNVATEKYKICEEPESGDGQWIGCPSREHSFWLHVYIYNISQKLNL